MSERHPPPDAEIASDGDATIPVPTPGQNEVPPAKQMSAMQAYMRIFTHGTFTAYLLQALAILAACGSGVALALVNLVLGDFISLLSGVGSGQSAPDDFMEQVSERSLYFVYIGIARFVCVYIYSTAMTYTALIFGRNLRYEYMRAALSQDIGFFDHGSAGSISMQTTSNGRLIQAGTAEKLGQMIQASVTFIAAFAIAFASQWKLTLILMCILPALILIVGTAGGIDAGIETGILKIYAQAGAYAESSLSNIRAIKAFSLAGRIVNRYAVYLEEARAQGRRKNVLYGLLFAGEYFVMFAGMGLAFWQGIAMIARGEIDDVGTVFTVLFSVIVAAAMLNSVAPNMVTFTRAATAAAELFTLIDRTSDIDPFHPSGDKPIDKVGEVEFRNVTFSYPTRPDIKVLDNFSLCIPSGKVTALVGASGSGKSTIIGLLERWYNLSDGEMMVAGQPIDKLNVYWLRTTMRLVQQEPVLFNGSVFENICYGLIGTPWESEAPEKQLLKVKEAAKMAFAHDFIVDLPKGYETCIGERGGLLSGGQRQRIAIARSIISDPKILLLDEATSALDPHAESIVQKALDQATQHRTTIVIAHKLKTVRKADNIVVMKKGKIIEQGRHEELLARAGAYAALVKAQDLSANEKEAALDDDSDERDTKETELKQSLSFAPHNTDARRDLDMLSEREECRPATSPGLICTALRLIGAAPELNWWSFLVLCSSVLGVSAAVYPVQALLLGKVMDAFNPELDQKRGEFYALMFFVIAIALFFVYMVMGWSSNHIAQTYGYVVRKRMFAAYLLQDLRFFDRPENTVGSLTSQIDSTAQSLFEMMGFTVALVCLSVFTILICSILSIAVAWKLWLVGVFAGIPLMILGGYLRMNAETKMNKSIDAKLATSASIAFENISAIRTVSSLAIENDVLRRYAKELDTAISDCRRPLVSMMLCFALTQSIEFFVLALGFWWGAKLMSEGDIGFYELIVSFMSVYFSGQGCATLFTFASSLTKARTAADFFFWLSSLEPLIRDTDQDDNNALAPGEYKSYEFDNVNFTYPLAPDRRVIKGLSMTIDPGQFVAFVGASGCGKSTIISLLQRFYDPTSGHIKVNNAQNLTELIPRLYRRGVSLVQQEPTLFPGSIRDNIAMGIDQDESDDQGSTVNDAAIEAACRAANVWEFVASLPEGLGTSCGAGGAQLSGGQRQRIAIARALIRKPRVMLLDEATSALDTESERIVQAALMEAASTSDRITVAVAHRLSTVMSADRIFVFSGGRIAESGTHSELLAQGGLYTKMCEAQNV